MPKRRALMIVNSQARRGGEALELVGQFEAAGIGVTVEQPERQQEISKIIQDRASQADLIIVCGGDGTMNAAADGVRNAGLPLGIIPLGTANDLARTLGIQSVAQAADVIVAGRLRAIDLGTVNHRPFFNVASVGLSADLARDLGQETKRRWGRLGYAIAALRVLATSRPFAAEIVSQSGSARVETLQISVGNGCYYGGGALVSEDASISDARLDLYSLEYGRVWKLLLLLGTFRRGRHGIWKEVRTDRGTEFEIRTRKPRSVNADGELVTTTPAHFGVLPKAVQVFVP